MKNRMTGQGAKAPGSDDWFRMRADQGRGVVYIYGMIGDEWSEDGVTSKRFARELDGLGPVEGIDVRIDSDGGGVFQAKTIYRLLRAHKAPVTVHVDGMAASSASLIAMAGDKILIADGAFMMIHNAWAFVIGDAKELRAKADHLEEVTETIRKVYAGRSGRDIEEITEWMNETKWFESADAVKFGFADEVVGEIKVAACLTNPFCYRNVPAALRPRRTAARARVAAMRELVAGTAGTV